MQFSSDQKGRPIDECFCSLLSTYVYLQATRYAHFSSDDSEIPGVCIICYAPMNIVKRDYIVILNVAAARSVE